MHNAELYAKSNDAQRASTEKFLPQYIPRMSWKSGERVLDVGCGDGAVTAQVLLPRLPDDFEVLLGADVSQPMLRLAASRFTNHRLKFLQMDMGKSIPADSELRTPGFDKIFSFYCLHWITDHRQAMQNIFELLRPGGETFLIFVTTSVVYDVWVDQSRKPQWQDYMKDYKLFMSPYYQSEDSARDFEAILKDLNFQVLDCFNSTVAHDCRQISRLKDVLRATNPFVDRMPKELQEEYMLEMLLEMTRRIASNNEKCPSSLATFHYNITVAYAKKL